MTISFKVSKTDFAKINAIADRAVAMAVAYDVDYTKSDALMDVTACHANGMPLDLDKLAGADEFNFAHDVFGIRRHINRETGVIEDCFVPRCSMSQQQRLSALAQRDAA